MFVAPDGDHYRVRLTHSLEVAQVGRVIARALGLDEDLTETLCLAHDIGHPPFGHAGEAALDDATRRHGGFDHNAQTLRMLHVLDSSYCDHPGLNLTWDTLEGLAKHNGPVHQPSWALEEIDEALPLDLKKWPSAEAQVAAVADDIAYDNHDIDDGLRAGFLKLEELITLDFVADQWRAVEKRFPKAPRERQLRELVRSQIGLMVNDVIATGRSGLSTLDSVDQVRGLGRQSVGFSPGLSREERMLKGFMYDRLYCHPDQQETAGKARDVIARLYSAYDSDPSLMPPDWRQSLPEGEPDRSRHIVDYIAGMTDRFAIDQVTRIDGFRPEGLSNV